MPQVRNTTGYFRHPAINGDTVVFVSEDDLWTVPASGGTAHRLTSGLGAVSHPALSPDGATVAFSSREEGYNEVYTMPLEGGQARRLTFLGGESLVVGWHKGEVVFASNARHFTHHGYELYTISPKGGAPAPLGLGPAYSISFGPGKSSVLGRNYLDPARWKRYRGGLCGELWVDRNGKGTFDPLVALKGNMVRPLWVGNRIYFVSDHDGIGALYSTTPEGKELRLESKHAEHYVRFPSADAKRIVYHAGGDLFVFDPKTRKTQKVNVDYRSPRTQRNRKFSSPTRYLEQFAINQDGLGMAAIVRGKAFLFGTWEGSVRQLGEPHGIRYRRVAWLPTGRSVVVAVHRGADDHLEVHSVTEREAHRSVDEPLGRVTAIIPAPKGDLVAVTNHRNELIVVDLKRSTVKLVERSRFHPIVGVDWSPDGRWLAYDCSHAVHQTALKLYSVADKKSTQITVPVLRDFSPHFDPLGRYLYFLSAREFNPIFDQLQFDLAFPCGVRPYLILLDKNAPHPFIRDSLNETPKKKPEDKKDGGDRPHLRVDLDGITQRIIPMPVSEGRYSQIQATEKKVFLVRWPIQSALEEPFALNVNNRTATLSQFDLESQETTEFISDINHLELSGDRKMVAYRAEDHIRVIQATEKPSTSSGYSKKSGWVNLGRLKVEVDPNREWEQMFREAWVLQREHFWTEDMSSVDWNQVYKRYRPLLDRVNTRAELSDLIWEMQGELGTSHAYEYGGDHRPYPFYGIGFLGAEFSYDRSQGGWKVDAIPDGDLWSERRSSPLARPGSIVQPGEVIVAVNNQELSATVPPEALLVSQGGSSVSLTLQSGGKRKKTRSITVQTLRSEAGLRYRAWVEDNRRIVHAKTGDRVGYIHVPDMGPDGFAAFHRLFLAESDREGVIVDVRYNRGGFVSSLLLSKLARKHLGYDVSRWMGTKPFPEDAIRGPLVALCNEYTASDGDIFSHCFKAMKLGPLVGKRTWGGVIGIWPRAWLVDGGMTTQPEYSFWFHDRGWGVENHGADPDVVVEFPPHLYKAGDDPQLAKAIALSAEMLKTHPSPKPDLKSRPKLRLPKH